MTSVMNVLGSLLVLGAIWAALMGLGSLTHATYGVGLIAFAAFLAALARIAQAGWHRNVQSKELEDLRKALEQRE